MNKQRKLLVYALVGATFIAVGVLYILLNKDTDVLPVSRYVFGGVFILLGSLYLLLALVRNRR